jgi:RNA recognition motif-containing protein
MTRLYVGNIRYSADEASLRALFEAFGPVREVFIGIDRDTGRSAASPS